MWQFDNINSHLSLFIHILWKVWKKIWGKKFTLVCNFFGKFNIFQHFLKVEYNMWLLLNVCCPWFLSILSMFEKSGRETLTPFITTVLLVYYTVIFISVLACCFSNMNTNLNLNLIQLIKLFNSIKDVLAFISRLRARLVLPSQARLNNFSNYFSNSGTIQKLIK